MEMLWKENHWTFYNNDVFGWKKKGQEFLILYILLSCVIVIEDTEWHGFVFKDL